MPIHFGEGARMRIVYTTARFEVMSHRSIGQSTLHRLWRRLLRHPESHRSIRLFTLKRLLKHPESHRSMGQSTLLGLLSRHPIGKLPIGGYVGGGSESFSHLKTRELGTRRRSPRIKRIRRNGVTGCSPNPDNRACFPDDARSARQQTPSNYSIRPF